MASIANNNIVHRSIPGQLVLLISLTIGGMLIFTLIGSVISSFAFGVDLQSLALESDLNNGKNYINAMKFLQVFVTSGTFLIPAIALPYYLKEKPTVFLGINSTPTYIFIGYIVLLFVCLFPFLEWLVEFNANMKLPESMKAIETWMQNRENQLEEFTMKLLVSNKLSDVFINIFVVAIVPAIMEELFFRGLIQNLLKRWFGNIHISILITSIFFSAIHIQFYGFLPRMLLGMILGYVFFWSGSIWTSIFAHFLNNTVAVILVYLSQKEIINYQIDQPMNTSNLVTIVSFGVTALLILLLAKYYDKRRDKTKDLSKIYSGNNIHEVEIKKSILDNNGIKAFIINKRDSSLTNFGPIELYVEPSDETKAKELIINNES